MATSPYDEIYDGIGQSSIYPNAIETLGLQIDFDRARPVTTGDCFGFDIDTTLNGSPIVLTNADPYPDLLKDELNPEPTPTAPLYLAGDTAGAPEWVEKNGENFFLDEKCGWSKVV